MRGSGKTAIVTGASSGIGRALALRLAGEGYRLLLVGSTPARVRAATEQANALPETLPKAPHLGLALSVADECQATRMAAFALERFGRIDLLVASAGTGGERGRSLPHPTRHLPLSEWQEVLDVNLTGTFLSNRAVLPAMRARREGQILNIGSSTTPYGLRGTPFAPAYCASKFGLVGLTEALAAELAGQGVRVQVLFPGPVDTPLIANTALARPFGGSITSEHFAGAVIELLHAPMDSVVVHPHLLPYREKRASHARPG